MAKGRTKLDNIFSSRSAQRYLAALTLHVTQLRKSIENKVPWFYNLPNQIMHYDTFPLRYHVLFHVNLKIVAC